MGGVGRALFGGSKSKEKSSSYNQGYGAISSALTPVMGYASEGGNLMKAFLTGDMSGFDAYKKNTGYDFLKEEGQDGITGNAAAQGLLRSGSTAKELVKFGNDLQQTFADRYFDKLNGFSGLGINAANAIGAAGQVSKSSAKSKSKNGGLGKLLGKAATAAAMASDPRLKTNVEKIGELDNGLGVYRYEYIDHPLTIDYAEGPHVGVMADEVARIQPEALGPLVDGYRYVDYSKISGLENF